MPDGLGYRVQGVVGLVGPPHWPEALCARDCCQVRAQLQLRVSGSQGKGLTVSAAQVQPLQLFT
jgi:hypothetical protein